MKAEEPLAIEGKALPETQKCKYCERQAVERVIHAEGSAYVPVCGEHRSTAIRAVGGTNAVANIQPIEAKDLKIPKQVPATYLRAGDVVAWWGSVYSIVDVKSEAGTVDIQVLNSDGAVETWRGVEGKRTWTTVARRLHAAEAKQEVEECWVGLGS